MHVPQWLALLIAGAVILFGGFRLYLAFGGPPDEERAKARRGLYAMPRWQHGLVGVLFLVVAGALVATAYGWNPVATKASPQRIKTTPAAGGGGNAITIEPK